MGVPALEYRRPKKCYLQSSTITASLSWLLVFSCRNQKRCDDVEGGWADNGEDGWQQGAAGRTDGVKAPRIESAAAMSTATGWTTLRAAGSRGGGPGERRRG
jgi:hypothetical protein